MGFKTTAGTPIKHEPEMRELAEAIMKPEKVTVINAKDMIKLNQNLHEETMRQIEWPNRL